jgi:hypothetical protein
VIKSGISSQWIEQRDIQESPFKLDKTVINSVILFHSGQYIETFRNLLAQWITRWEIHYNFAQWVKQSRKYVFKEG